MNARLPVVDMDEIPQSEVERIYQHTIEELLRAINTIPTEGDTLRVQDIDSYFVKTRITLDAMRCLCEAAPEITERKQNFQS
ncbi:hypothetical protein [Nitrosococcus wardiae]|uniref:Uncharacterized protein n=1 Tax=Nitrosococcus wardiae TaxID=1814290 RepID=A0A4P7C5R5_9GAMM|nr:hypothetical protein [Nitrosococcus wardiae]QBQ56212.1 hypothetical protein E3U44_18175 [Nitrosococcus wardiae]